AQARQFVRHGHIRVNGRKVDIPSYLVKEGDVISVKEKSRNIPAIVKSVEARDLQALPAWLSLEKEKFEGRVVRLPVRADITHPINERLIVELYSK
ncbi:MAG TPA: 30S ribosomal protein S4, partial [candidate division WOR-3 bacterium]|nr:30S ribosomal protein S4 [candidate division WOR-3 bacterium]